VEHSLNKKGDIILDYMLDYGWLFIFLMLCLVIISIALINHGFIGTSACTGHGDMICKNVVITTQEIGISIQSKKMRAIEVTAVAFVDEKCGSRQVFERPIRVKSLEEYRFTFQCNDFPASINSEIFVDYRYVVSGMTGTDKLTLKYVRE